MLGCGCCAAAVARGAHARRMLRCACCGRTLRGGRCAADVALRILRRGRCVRARTRGGRFVPGHQLQAPPSRLQPQVPLVLQHGVLSGGMQPLHRLQLAALPAVELRPAEPAAPLRPAAAGPPPAPPRPALDPDPPLMAAVPPEPPRGVTPPLPPLAAAGAPATAVFPSWPAPPGMPAASAPAPPIPAGGAYVATLGAS
jgi:hypothetical protein